MEREEYIDAQMLCNAFVDEVVTQIKDIEDRCVQIERPFYEEELVDTLFKAAKTIEETGDSFPPAEISHFVRVAATLLNLMPRERRALHEPAITLLLDTAALIKKTIRHLPSPIAC